MSDKLRPCPFCDSTDIQYFQCDRTSWWYLQCQACDARTAINTSQELVAKNWNSRPLEKVAVAEERERCAMVAFEKAPLYEVGELIAHAIRREPTPTE